jgi:hypothetical protein
VGKRPFRYLFSILYANTDMKLVHTRLSRTSVTHIPGRFIEFLESVAESPVERYWKRRLIRHEYQVHLLRRRYPSTFAPSHTKGSPQTCKHSHALNTCTGFYCAPSPSLFIYPSIFLSLSHYHHFLLSFHLDLYLELLRAFIPR